MLQVLRLPARQILESIMPRDRTPGPGAYNLDVRPITPTSPSYTIAAKTPSPGANDGPPGPGTYNSKGTFGGPAYTFPGKYPTVDLEKRYTPGPGYYNVGSSDIVHHKEPAYTLAGRRKFEMQGYGPGPGAYTLPRVDGGPAHTMTGKRSPSPTPKSPGPGSYSPTSRPESPAFTMASRYRKGTRDGSPGPGQYHPRDQSNGPAYTITGRWTESPTAPTTPGPGAYQLDLGAALIYQRDPAYSISSRKRVVLDDPGPGPGTYTPLPSSRTDPGPAYTIGWRSSVSASAETPGPGAYYRERKHGGPAYTISGKTPRSHGESSPGPGAYSPKFVGSGPAYSIPRKCLSRRRCDSPGPAAYNLDTHCIQMSPPKFSMGMRFDDRGKDICPGPGSYDPRLHGRGPAYTMASGTQRFADF